MTAIETIKELYTLKDDLVRDAAAVTTLSADNEGILIALCSWAAHRSGEDMEKVLQEVEQLVAAERLNLPVLREILEAGKG